MNFLTASEFTGQRAWDAQSIAEIDGASVRLHWTDEAYIWHENDGEEVFVVLDGEVDMQFRQRDNEEVRRMQPGDICHARAGDEHKAVSLGAARILVIERKGSL